MHEVAAAFRLALDSASASGHVLNVGSGQSASVLEVADLLCDNRGDEELRPHVTGTARVGDVRHCFADITLARELLGFEPRVKLEEGLAEFVEWLRTQAAEDRVETAMDELVSRGLAL